jgi:mercuric reductase
MAEHFDLVILGSGSTAFAAALRAAELGKTAAMTEFRTLGGTCVNRGCLPSKNLIEAAKIFYEAKNPRCPGLRPGSMTVDFHALMDQKDELIHDYRNKKYQSIIDGSKGIKVFAGRAELKGPHEVSVNGRTLTGERLLIATGTAPQIPDIPGLSSTPFLTSDLLTSQEEGTELRELPASLVIIGGGYIAVELGQMFARLGTEVTILERGERILSGGEPEISESVAASLRDEGLIIHTGAKVVRVQGDGVQVTVTAQAGGRHQEFKAARLLVATGRRPNTEGIGLERAQVEVDNYGFVKVDDELRTSVGHIFAAGDVVNSYTHSQMATPVGAQDGGIAAENALSSASRKVNHALIPRAVFCDPQVGSVGLTDEEANAQGYTCECRTVPMTLVPRAGAVRASRGVIKMVAERNTHKVLGVSMHGLNAAEVIHEAAMGMRFGAKIEDFAAMLHVYPTMAEALKIVALAYAKDVSKLSCCAE